MAVILVIRIPWYCYDNAIRPGATFSGNFKAASLVIAQYGKLLRQLLLDGQDVDLTTGFAVSNSAADNYNVVINSSTFDAAGDTNFLNGGTVSWGNADTDVITFAVDLRQLEAMQILEPLTLLVPFKRKVLRWTSELLLWLLQQRSRQTEILLQVMLISISERLELLQMTI